VTKLVFFLCRGGDLTFSEWERGRAEGEGTRDEGQGEDNHDNNYNLKPKTDSSINAR
jgi:hypothetical protein